MCGSFFADRRFSWGGLFRCRQKKKSACFSAQATFFFCVLAPSWMHTLRILTYRYMVEKYDLRRPDGGGRTSPTARGRTFYTGNNTIPGLQFAVREQHPPAQATSTASLSEVKLGVLVGLVGIFRGLILRVLDYIQRLLERDTARTINRPLIGSTL